MRSYEFHSHPQQVHADLIAQLEKLQQQTEIVLNKEKALGEKNQEILANAYNSTIKFFYLSPERAIYTSLGHRPRIDLSII